MVDSGTASQVAKMSIQLTGAFTIVGTALLYLYIAISEASNQTKVLWASGLTLCLAFIFLIVWTLARDWSKRDREPQKKVSP
jgi:Ca2+/Na+ antiporter